MKNIVTLTPNPSLDMNTRVKQVMADKKLRCEKPVYEPGGGGINVSRALKKLGTDSLAIYTSGGHQGKYFTQLLENEDIKTNAVNLEEMTRESFMVTEVSSGQQFRFSVPGPKLKKKEWNSILDSLKDNSFKPDFVVASGSIPLGVPDKFYALASSIAGEFGAKFIIDSHGKAMKKAADEGAYILKNNLREFGELVGHEVEDEEAQMKAAKKLVKKGKITAVIVTLGAGGALLVTKEEHIRIHAPTVDIKSRVGAGDSMTAGIVAALAEGKSIREAVVYGVASGSAAVMTPGTELCRKEDVRKLYKSMSNS